MSAKPPTIAGGSMKSKSLSYVGRQPWLAWSCRICSASRVALRRHYWHSSAPLETRPRSWRLETCPRSWRWAWRPRPRRPWDWHSSELRGWICVAIKSFIARFATVWEGSVIGRGCLSHAMCRPTASQVRPREQLRGQQGWRVLDLLALENDVFQRCLSAQPDTTALQRSNRGKCADLLCDLDATPTCRPTARFSLCSCWNSPTSGGPRHWGGDVFTLAARLILALNCTPPGTQTQLHSSFQTLGSRPAFSLTSSRLLPLLTAGDNLATCHLCTRLRVREVVVEEFHILDTLNYELAVITLADSVRLFPLFLESWASSAALPTGDWLTPLIAGARPFRGTRKHGPASGSHRELCFVPLALGMDQLLAVRGSLSVEPHWLGPRLSTRVLLLFLRLLSLASWRGLNMGTFSNFSLSLRRLDRSTDVGTELSTRVAEKNLLCCCNKVWMKNGGRIPWNVTAICEIFRIFIWWEDTIPFNGPVIPFGAMVEYHPISAEDLSRSRQFGPKVLPGKILGYASHAGRRRVNRGHWRMVEDGRIWTPRLKAQCKRSVNAKERWKFHISQSQMEQTIHFNKGSSRTRRGTRSFRGESDGTESSWYDGEAKRDFWSISGDFIYRHHQDPWSNCTCREKNHFLFRRSFSTLPEFPIHQWM